MALNFPANPAAQTPANVFSPTSTPDATTNGVTYVWDGEKWTTSVGVPDAYVLKSGDTMTGELIVPNLSSPSGNLPIQRASVADSEVQSFNFQSANHLDWYPFNPIPTWCNHIRYDISVVLSGNAVGSGGFYLRWGSASGPLLANEVSESGTQTSILENGPGAIYYSDPLLLPASQTQLIYYDYVMDYYIYNRGVGGGDDFYCYGIGHGAQTGNSPVLASVSTARMIVQYIHPVAPNIIMPDRMGALFFGGSTNNGQNTATIKQTFMTDGPVGFPADIGPTPTPI